MPKRHLIYLHGRIVQDQQSARPHSERFGYYELDAIRKALARPGFVLAADIRPKAATPSESADKVAAQERALIAAGIAPDRITVVGGSMGGYIALMASTRLQEKDLRFVVMGGCLAANARTMREEEGRSLAGRLLSIREESDDLGGPCETWNPASAAGTPLEGREIVLHTGLGHGFLYRPLPEWLEPVLAWSNGLSLEASGPGSGNR